MKIFAKDFEMATREGVEGLLALDGEIGPFRQALLRHFSRNASHLSQLQKIGEAFQRVGIEAIALKGASLLNTVYPNIGARPMGDIDLLVWPEDRGKARSCLSELGYTQGKVGLVGPGAHVDLHDRLMGEECVRPDRSAFHFPMEDLWAEACPTEWPAISRLSPEHQVLHLCVHALKHSYSRLIWMVDIQRCLATVNHAKLAYWAEQTRSQRALAYALLLLPRFGLEVSIPSRIRLSRMEKWMLSRAEQRSLSTGLGRWLMALSLPPRARRHYWRELAFPPRSQRHSLSAEQSSLRYHLKRCLRVFRNLAPTSP